MSNRPFTLASWGDVPIMLMALDSAVRRRDACDSGAPAHRGEQYSFEVQTKTLLSVNSFDFSKE